jgi:5'(3')-deoxyribonucleotidase
MGRNRLKLALDLDGVLADLQSAMVEHTAYCQQDFEQWEKPNHNTFLSEASYVWSDYWQEIEPVEKHLSTKTGELSQQFEVDIVTNTVGSNDVVEQWLSKHGVVYEELVRPYSLGTDKQHLDYDVYVDDKPSLHGTVPLLLLRDRRWNQTIRGGIGEQQYFYYSYEPSYIEVEGTPEKSIIEMSEAYDPYVVRITGLRDVLLLADN